MSRSPMAGVALWKAADADDPQISGDAGALTQGATPVVELGEGPLPGDALGHGLVVSDGCGLVDGPRTNRDGAGLASHGAAGGECGDGRTVRRVGGAGDRRSAPGYQCPDPVDHGPQSPTGPP
jgi:hypothetical protein